MWNFHIKFQICQLNHYNFFIHEFGDKFTGYIIWKFRTVDKHPIRFLIIFLPFLFWNKSSNINSRFFHKNFNSVIFYSFCFLKSFKCIRYIVIFQKPFSDLAMDSKVYILCVSASLLSKKILICRSYYYTKHVTISI